MEFHEIISAHCSFRWIVRGPALSVHPHPGQKGREGEKVERKIQRTKPRGGAVWLRGRAAWSAAAARPDQSGPSHSDRALGTECPPGVLGTSEGRVTRQVVTRQHRELARCLGTR